MSLMSPFLCISLFVRCFESVFLDFFLILNLKMNECLIYVSSDAKKEEARVILYLNELMCCLF